MRNEKIDSPVLTYFSKKLIEERKRRKISQERLAALAGITRVYPSNVERMIVMPSIEYMHKMISALGMSVSEFFQDFKE